MNREHPAYLELANARSDTAARLHKLKAELAAPDPFFLRRLLGTSEWRSDLRQDITRMQDRLHRLMQMTPDSYEAELKREFQDTPIEQAFRRAAGVYRKPHERTPFQRILFGLIYEGIYMPSPGARLRSHWYHRHWNNCEAAVKQKYPDAILRWNELEERAKAHGIRFCGTAEAHHRAAILDHLDNPEAPVLFHAQYMTRFGYVDLRQPHQVVRELRRAAVFARLQDEEDQAAAAFAGEEIDPRFWLSTRVLRDGSKVQKDGSPRACRLRAEAALARHLSGRGNALKR